MPAKTTAHTLQLVAGPLRVEIAESAEAVFFAITGAKPLGFEKRKLSAFLFPLVDAYRSDTRRMEVSGQHSPLTGHVRKTPGGAWMVYEMRTEAQQ
jgi:hypothetical protein